MLSKKSKPLLELPLENSNFEEFEPEKEPNCFEITLGKKAVVFRAPKLEEMYNWLNALLKHKFLKGILLWLIEHITNRHFSVEPDVVSEAAPVKEKRVEIVEEKIEPASPSHPAPQSEPVARRPTTPSSEPAPVENKGTPNYADEIKKRREKAAKEEKERKEREKQLREEKLKKEQEEQQKRLEQEEAKLIAEYKKTETPKETPKPVAQKQPQPAVPKKDEKVTTPTTKPAEEKTVPKPVTITTPPKKEEVITPPTKSKDVAKKEETTTGLLSGPSKTSAPSRRAPTKNPVRERQERALEEEKNRPKVEEQDKKTQNKSEFTKTQLGGYGLLYALSADNNLFKKSQQPKKSSDTETQRDVRLIQIKGRRKCYVRQVELSRSSMNKGIVFLNILINSNMS